MLIKAVKYPHRKSTNDKLMNGCSFVCCLLNSFPIGKTEDFCSNTDFYRSELNEFLQEYYDGYYLTQYLPTVCLQTLDHYERKTSG